ncbi:hypothetical protein ABB37_03180 [Leptomonas pyrrhocoris]|uniref:DUF1935 domain-containing protein n=1 Tax=Leptomonas pyrrhocoris TaxID=157538 RepID=A0A0N0DWT4_LEPPY|nr:hypothetical protein ABB37_03180 [Leptomonas pyrrhocoris]XP_015660441.1 hypothetical protein ABB37_03180 [Leptomonas pyrrhocoris]XP_015660442.1 hypothetical protein ABB37_03180 [Leptomonas pyrrhocoris]KPA82001.1 hypothetical protein ABB37_03180 [Leptomonas pyrrhocoris]KPA82002.1 hypothetical protein ABB37_03180 [Leptomonas pyrrhocoris]KPA82003.1 hypothetical protein ABB37_03180 [Leptomonas pyrrhocoris]|eukprot:XP_015660440.1 hypothetical protein ABB37_03180 [Leptomonas pyrrhocoris]
MTDEVTQEVQFENGHPAFSYDHVYRCFKGDSNGLLFRLVNDTNHKWAFYNDTKDTVMRVKAHFSADSKVKAAGRAKATAVPVEDQEELQETIITVEVMPMATEVFIDGEANGFSLDFQTEQMPATNVKFMNQRNTLPPYTKLYKCFKNEGNGLFFRLVDEENKKWYYYNDTKDFMMTSTVTFPRTEDVAPVGNTLEVEAEDAGNDVAYQITVAPGNCEEFIEGSPAAYRQAFNADPIDENCLDPKDVQFKHSEPDRNVVDLDNCKIYKCFKDNGNGLLFRIVDHQNQMWAFYNDTTEYVMRPKVRFFGSPSIALAPGAEVVESEEEDGSYAVTIEVPPLATVHFIDGLPSKYEVSVVADSVNKTAPEENPEFQTGEPDKNLVNYDEVYQCFKDKPDARLFRLVDTQRHRWGFFNDTADVEFTATFSFDADGAVLPLGSTSQEGDEFSVNIPPGSTEAFVQGSVKGFKSKFTGKRRAAAAAQAQ